MKKLNKKTRLKLIIMLICAIIMVCGSGVTYSLFTSESNLVANQKIAKFIFYAQKTDLIELPISDLKPGDKVDYTFKVANTLDNKKSDVTISYKIIMKTYHFMPLNINLYKVEDDKETLIITCDESISRTDNQILCNTDTQHMMSHNKEVQDNYRLEVEFPKKYNTEAYTELVDFIDIEIKSWQTIGE